MRTVNIVRLVVQTLAILAILAGVCLVTVGVLTSSWQTYEDISKNEVHQHGLWIDWTRTELSSSALANPREWYYKLKFGQAVVGDKSHEAKEYHITTLIMLCTSVVLALLGLGCAGCSYLMPMTAVGWLLSVFLAAVVSVAGLANFYIRCMEPDKRFINHNGQFELFVGYSFWYAVDGTALYAVGAVLTIFAAVFIFLGPGMTKTNTPRTFPKSQKAGKGHNTSV